MKVLTPISGRDLCSKVLLLGLFLSSAVLGNEFPEPPVNSSIAFRALPMEVPGQSDLYGDLEDHPLIRIVERVGAETVGINPIDLLNNTLEGTIVAAIAPPLGEESSSLDAYFTDRRLRERWTETTEELGSLASDLDDYKAEEGSYPQDIQVYLDEIRYYEPYLPYGVEYRYQVLQGGEQYRLEAVFSEESGLGDLGNPPVYTGNEPPKNVKPTAPPVPLNLSIGLRIKNKAQVETVLRRFLGEPQQGFWFTESGDFPAMEVTIREDWLVLSDRRKAMGGFLRAVTGKAPGWSKNPSFPQVSRNIDSESPFFLFVDTQKLIASAKPTKGMFEDRLLPLVGPIGYSIVPYTESQMKLEVFMGVNPPQDSQMADYFQTTAQESPASSIVTSNIPWDVSHMFAVDVQNVKELVDSGVALFPEYESDYQMGQDVFAGMLGLDAEAGFNELVGGSALVTFERIDIFLNTLESTMAEASQIEESLDTGDGEATDEVVEPQAPNPLTYVPFTFAAQVPLEVNRTAAKSLLESQMKGDTTTESLFGVDIVSGEEGRVSYAQDGEWFYVSGGGTVRLMKHMLEAAHGRKETLNSIDSWSRFTVGRRGRLLAFGHQKVDMIYAFVKGFLLLLGSEFRPVATEIGKLRDYHTVVTAVPDGVLIVGEMLQGDER